MLNADSSTLNSDSDDQSRNIPPTIPSEVALSWIVRITSALVLDEQGSPSASTLDDARTGDLAEGVKALVDAAARAADRDGGLAQLEVATPAGSVFVVRDGKRTIAATTKPEPAAGL